MATLPTNSGHLGELIEKSKNNGRGREGLLIIPWGKNMNPRGITPACMINVLQPGSYCQPHRHDYGIEKIEVVTGKAISLLFEDSGNLCDITVLERDQSIVVPKSTYHFAFAWEPNLVEWEKYYPDQLHETFEEYKQFASWAPAEGDAGARKYFHGLIRQVETEKGMKYEWF